MRDRPDSLWVLAAACLAAGSAPQERAGIDPIYYRFSAWVEIARDGDEVVVRPPAGRDGQRRVELRIPVVPSLAESPREAPPGVVGIAVNGDLLLNREPQLAPLGTSRSGSGPGAPGIEVPRGPGPLGRELDLTALVGMMLDGYALYGPADRDGEVPGGLDDCHGHVGLTPDDERASYHYHVVVGARLIAPCFRGVPGRAR